ncbi:hypothetical protein BD779DRAFT_1791677 [Infundibulicybe gibba]|nr:hypothetical protein BD779DRAFT_1791677 [Infundibulicybe gibba]
MATLIRSAKSGNQWTSHELKAFNIQVLQQDASSFFSLQELPAPSDISPAIWNNVAAPPAVELSRNERRFFTFLRDAADPEEPFIIDFAVFLLREILKYDDDDGHRTLHTQRDSEMPFHMCGSKVYTNADVVMHGRLSDGFQYTLLVQEDKHRKPFDDPEAQLVAKAIAAFHHNMRARRMNQLPALESQTFPAITMAVQQPISLGGAGRRIPANATIVHRFVPPIDSLDETGYISTGMVPLESRRILFQCFEAFKRFL